MIYNVDGSIQKLPWWNTKGVQQLGTLNLFIKNEAEAMAFSEEIKTEFDTEWVRDIAWNKGKKLLTDYL